MMKIKGFKHSIKSKFVVLSILAVWMVALSGCFFLPKEEEVLAPPLKEPPKITYNVIEVKKSVFEKKTECTGYFIAVTQKDLSFSNQGGRLKQIYVKTGDKVKKGDLLAEMVTEDLESQIKLEEIGLKKAKMAYDMAVASDDSKFNIQRAELDMETEKVKLEALKRNLANARLLSPMDGVVNFVTDAKNGDYLDAYKNVVRVAGSEDLRVQYNGDKVSDFELGMVVQININDKVYPGKVVMNPSNTPADASEEIRQCIQIKADNLPKDIQIGDKADITLILIKKDQAIVIPKNVIRALGARKYVNVLENGIKRERDIEVGSENITEAEIVKGLNEGDQLIKD